MSIAFTSMCDGEPRRELVAEAGEQVDRAAGNVARRERLGELDRGERARLGRERDDRVPADERGREPRDEPEERRLSGATIPTTPVGSGTVKLKYGPATGFDEPSTCASLSAKPAYQTQRSIARSTSSSPARELGELGRRASIISAIR